MILQELGAVWRGTGLSEHLRRRGTGSTDHWAHLRRRRPAGYRVERSGDACRVPHVPVRCAVPSESGHLPARLRAGSARKQAIVCRFVDRSINLSVVTFPVCSWRCCTSTPTLSRTSGSRAGASSLSVRSRVKRGSWRVRSTHYRRKAPVCTTSRADGTKPCGFPLSSTTRPSIRPGSSHRPNAWRSYASGTGDGQWLRVLMVSLNSSKALLLGEGSWGVDIYCSIFRRTTGVPAQCELDRADLSRGGAETLLPFVGSEGESAMLNAR